MKCIWYESCEHNDCKNCWCYDDGKDEERAIKEYFEWLAEAQEEYEEMIEDYSDGNW